MASAEERRRIYPKITKPNPVKRSKVAVNGLAEDPQRIPKYATSHELRSKSATLFKELTKSSRKGFLKQAWSHEPLHSLDSTSSRQIGFKEFLKPRKTWASFVNRDEQAFGRVRLERTV